MSDVDLKMTYIHQMNTAISDKAKSEILLTALSAVSDVDWLENFYIHHAQSHSPNIARLSLTCIGHLARIYENINTNKVIPFLKALKISNPTLASTAQNALDDIDIFVHKT